MTQIPENPAASASAASVRSPARRPLAPSGHPNTGTCNPKRSPTGVAACACASAAVRATLRGAVRTGAGSSSTSHPSPASPSCWSRNCAT